MSLKHLSISLNFADIFMLVIKNLNTRKTKEIHFRIETDLII